MSAKFEFANCIETYAGGEIYHLFDNNGQKLAPELFRKEIEYAPSGHREIVSLDTERGGSGTKNWHYYRIDLENGTYWLVAYITIGQYAFVRVIVDEETIRRENFHLLFVDAYDIVKFADEHPDIPKPILDNICKHGFKKTFDELTADAEPRKWPA